MAMANSSARALSRLQVIDNVPGCDYAVRYLGKRADLIAAGVATPEMFPAGKRKWGRAEPRTPQWYATTRRGPDLFLVSRWNGKETSAEWHAKCDARWGIKRETDTPYELTPTQRLFMCLTGPVAHGTTAPQQWAIDDVILEIEETLDAMLDGAADEDIDINEAQARCGWVKLCLDEISRSLHDQRNADEYLRPGGFFSKKLEKRYGV